MLSIKRAIGYFIGSLRKDVSNEAAVGAIGAELFDLASSSPIAFPAQFVFLLRAITTLEGTGKKLDEGYSFVNVAAPYAAELLAEVEAERGGGSTGANGEIEWASLATAAASGDITSAGTLVLGQLRRAATEQASLAAAMPSRVARVDRIMASLEAGDLQLRVRDLAGERAARRAGVIAASSLNAAGALGFLNLGALLALAATDGVEAHAALGGPAGACLALSAVFGVLVLRGFRRVKRLDSFEKRIRGG
jgi:hypothetical protein